MEIREMLKSLVEKVKAVPVAPVSPQKQEDQLKGPRVRDLRKEIEKEEIEDLTAELFRGLRTKERMVGELLALKRDLTTEEKVLGRTLEEEIREIKSAILANVHLAARWIATALSGWEDELMVSKNLVERGVLSEISLQERMAVGKGYYPVKDFSSDNSSTTRFFVRHVFKESEERPEGYFEELFYAYRSHFLAKWDHAKDVATRIAVMKKELGVDEKLTLVDVESGVGGVVSFDVLPEHDWRGRDGRSVTGIVVIKSLGDIGGISSFEILGAEGGIKFSLQNIIGSGEKIIFEFRTGRRFEGLSRADSGVEVAWLRVLLLKFFPKQERQPQVYPVSHNVHIMPTVKIVGIGNGPTRDRERHPEKTHMSREIEKRRNNPFRQDY